MHASKDELTQRIKELEVKPKFSLGLYASSLLFCHLSSFTSIFSYTSLLSSSFIPFCFPSLSIISILFQSPIHPQCCISSLPTPISSSPISPPSLPHLSSISPPSLPHLSLISSNYMYQGKGDHIFKVLHSPSDPSDISNCKTKRSFGSHLYQLMSFCFCKVYKGWSKWRGEGEEREGEEREGGGLFLVFYFLNLLCQEGELSKSLGPYRSGHS